MHAKLEEPAQLIERIRLNSDSPDQMGAIGERSSTFSLPLRFEFQPHPLDGINSHDSLPFSPPHPHLSPPPFSHVSLRLVT